MVRNRQRPKSSCPICGKKRVVTSPIAQPINEHDPSLYILKKCEVCNYTHATKIETSKNNNNND